MKAARTGKLPGYARHDEGGALQMAPQLIEHDGKPFLIKHAEGFTTGVVVTSESDTNERIVLTTWLDPTPASPIGIAFAFTPSDDMLDTIINSLTLIRDRRLAAASDMAAAAIAKAAGK